MAQIGISAMRAMIRNARICDNPVPLRAVGLALFMRGRRRRAGIVFLRAGRWSWAWGDASGARLDLIQASKAMDLQALADFADEIATWPRLEPASDLIVRAANMCIKCGKSVEDMAVIGQMRICGPCVGAVWRMIDHVRKRCDQVWVPVIPLRCVGCGTHSLVPSAPVQIGWLCSNCVDQLREIVGPS